MSIEIPLDTMTVAEKVRLLESVWDSLCAKPGDVQSPEWHREVLEARKRRLEEGRASVSSWDEAKARLMELVMAVLDARRDPLWIRRRLE